MTKVEASSVAVHPPLSPPEGALTSPVALLIPSSPTTSWTAPGAA